MCISVCVYVCVYNFKTEESRYFLFLYKLPLSFILKKLVQCLPRIL